MVVGESVAIGLVVRPLVVELLLTLIVVLLRHLVVELLLLLVRHSSVAIVSIPLGTSLTIHLLLQLILLEKGP